MPDLATLRGVIVIKEMTFASKRDNRVLAYLPVLETVCDMLNADTTAAMEGFLKEGLAVTRSEFQLALRAQFDHWLNNGKHCRSQNDEFQFLLSDTLTYRIGDTGAAEYYPNFARVGERTRTSTAEQQALVWFRLFLRSDGRNLLSKCSTCGRYFLRKRLSKRGQESRFGEFCAEHQQQIRINSTKEIRGAETRYRIAEAARLTIQSRKKAHTKQWEWVATQFNMKLHHSKKRMTVQWITLHKAEIISKMAEIESDHSQN